jgi:hypothetical protein
MIVRPGKAGPKPQKCILHSAARDLMGINGRPMSCVFCDQWGSRSGMSSHIQETFTIFLRGKKTGIVASKNAIAIARNHPITPIA